MVADPRFPFDTPPLFKQVHVDVVVHLLLPIGRPRGAGGAAGGRGGRPALVELAELIFKIVLGLSDLPLGRGEGEDKYKQEKVTQDRRHGELRCADESAPEAGAKETLRIGFLRP